MRTLQGKKHRESTDVALSILDVPAFDVLIMTQSMHKIIRRTLSIDILKLHDLRTRYSNRDTGWYKLRADHVTLVSGLAL